MKIRNYSFQSSKRLPENRMTEVNGIRIPSMPGSCYHAIMCTLAESKDQFCSWHKIYERTEYFMKMYGGDEVWTKFKNKNEVKTCEQRIKDNAHTLTRTGRDCYGYRLHERGMVIYFFKDGAVLYTGGQFVKTSTGYQVKFPDGKGLQTRYRGTTMTYKEYKRFLDMEYIDASGNLKKPELIRKFRSETSATRREEEQNRISVSITLDDSYNQDTAFRLQSMGLIVTNSENNEIAGTLPKDKLDSIIEDEDVVDVVVA